jgi:hypothetical protein
LEVTVRIADPSVIDDPVFADDPIYPVKLKLPDGVIAPMVMEDDAL